MPQLASSLTITRHPYEEPHHVNLVVHVATDGAAARQEIYALAADLAAFADAMRGFPKRPDDRYSWELGSEDPDDRFAFYFRLSIQQIRPRGRCAVHVRFSNNEGFPEGRTAEFSFGAMPADLDRLGGALAEFAKLEQTVLEWRVEDDALS